MNTEHRGERRPRGVRLSDLDRERVYRIGYVSQRRRWEVFGPEAPAAAGRDAGGTDAGERAACGPRPAPAPGPRHASTEPVG